MASRAWLSRTQPGSLWASGMRSPTLTPASSAAGLVTVQQVGVHIHIQQRLSTWLPTLAGTASA